MRKLVEFVKREDGVTAPEYALIAALIAAFIIAAVTDLGAAVSGVFGDIAAAINGAVG